MAGRHTWTRPSDSFDPIPGTDFPQSVRIVGSNYTIEGLAFDGTTTEGGGAKFRVAGYTGGNLTLAVDCEVASGTTGAFVLGAAIAAVTPDTDTQDIETKAFATEVTGTKSHLGTTGKRLHRLTITINQLDSVADGDWCMLRLRRLPGDAGDTMTGIDVYVSMVDISWS